MSGAKRKYDQIVNTTDGDPATLGIVEVGEGPLKKICGVRGIGGIDCSIVENTLLIDGNGAPGVVEISAAQGIVCTPDPITGTGSVGVTNMEVDGFTGQTAYNTGDTLYADGSNSLARRAIGNEDDIYKVVGGVPTWAPNPADGVTSIAAADSSITLTPDPIVSTGTIAVTHPMPDPSGGDPGDVLMLDASNNPQWEPSLSFLFELQVNPSTTPPDGIAYVDDLTTYTTIYFGAADATGKLLIPYFVNMTHWAGASGTNTMSFTYSVDGGLAVNDSGTPAQSGSAWALGDLSYHLPLSTGQYRVCFVPNPHIPPDPDIAAYTLIGNNTGVPANAVPLTGTQATALLDTFSTSSTTKGLVIGSNGVSTDNFLRADNTWATPPGGGTVDSITAGTGITCAPNPIVDSGTISVTNPMPPPSTGAAGYSLVLDSIPSAGWEKPLSYVFNLSVNASTLPPGGNVYIPSLVSNYVMYFPASDLNILTTGEVFTNMAAWQSAGGSGYSNMTMIFQQGTGLSGSSYAYTGQVASTGFGCWSFTSPFAFPNTLLTDIIRVMFLPNPKLNPNVANNTVMGNVSGGSAEAIPLTAAQATGVLDSFAGSIKGLVPTGSGGSTSVYLRGDGSWNTPPGTYTPPAVNNNTLMGNNSGGSAAPSALTGTQATALLDTFSTSSTTKGLVNGSNSAGNTTFLRADNTWAVPPGTTGSEILRFAGPGVGVAEGGGVSVNLFSVSGSVTTYTSNTVRTVAQTVTPKTTVQAFPLTINSSTGDTSQGSTFITSTSNSAGSIDLVIGYSSAYNASSFTSLMTTSIAYNAASLEAVKSVGVTWSPTSATMPADSILILKITNNLTSSGSGTCSTFVYASLTV